MIVNYAIYVDENKTNQIILYCPEGGLKGSKTIVDMLKAQGVEIFREGTLSIRVQSPFSEDAMAHILLSLDCDSKPIPAAKFKVGEKANFIEPDDNPVTIISADFDTSAIGQDRWRYGFRSKGHNGIAYENVLVPWKETDDTKARLEAELKHQQELREKMKKKGEESFEDWSRPIMDQMD